MKQETLTFTDGIAYAGEVVLAPELAIDALLGGAWIPVRVRAVTESATLMVTVDDGRPCSHDSYSLPLASGTLVRLRQ